MLNALPHNSTRKSTRYNLSLDRYDSQEIINLYNQRVITLNEILESNARFYWEFDNSLNQLGLFLSSVIRGLEEEMEDTKVS